MRNETFLRALALVGAGLLAVACGDDGGDGEGMQDGGVDGGMEVPDDDGGVDGGMPPEDGNDGFEDAVELTIGTPETHTIDFPGDPDWFTFTASAGDWVLVRATATAAFEGEPVPDPAVIVYDPDEAVFAANTDRVAGGGSTAGELIMRIPETGGWFVQISQQTAGRGAYEILVSDASPRPGILEDAETGDDAASAADNDVGTDFQSTGLGDYLIGTFEDATDIDVFRFEITGDDPASTNPGFHVGGRSTINDEDLITLASGSSASPARVWVTTAADPDTILARFDEELYENGAPFGRTVQPSLSAGVYLLWVAPDGEPVGDNPYYFGRIRTSNENPVETMDEANDAVAGAEPIEQMMGDGIRNGFILATLGDDDVDHFSVTTTGTMQPYAVCGSRVSGSGILGLQLSLLSSAGTVLNACGEGGADPCTATEDLANGPGNLVLFAGGRPPGTYVVRLSKSGQDPDVTGNWVRCGLGAVEP